VHTLIYIVVGLGSLHMNPSSGSVLDGPVVAVAVLDILI
jgi:hypothetical protein